MDERAWTDRGPTDESPTGVPRQLEIGDTTLGVTTPQNAHELCGDGRQ
jgi:hypothetical protein